MGVNSLSPGISLRVKSKNLHGMEEEHCLSAGLLKRRDYILPNCCYLLTYVLTYSLLSESFVPSSDRRSVDTRFIVQCTV